MCIHIDTFCSHMPHARPILCPQICHTHSCRHMSHTSEITFLFSLRKRLLVLTRPILNICHDSPPHVTCPSFPHTSHFPVLPICQRHPCFSVRKQQLPVLTDPILPICHTSDSPHMSYRSPPFFCAENTATNSRRRPPRLSPASSSGSRRRRR